MRLVVRKSVGYKIGEGEKVCKNFPSPWYICLRHL